jgi:hypothetical protein
MYNILKPPVYVFLNQARNDTEQVMQQESVVPILEKIELPAPDVEPTFTGMYLWYKGLPFPKKGFPFPEALAAVNTVKRFTMFFTSFVSRSMLFPLLGFVILPFKYKVKIIEKMLFNYCRLCNWVLNSFYLKEQYYANCPHELWKLITNFLIELGITEQTAVRTGQIIATLIEYDDAYQYRIEDLFSLTTKEKMLLNPRMEIKKMLSALSNREVGMKEDEVGGKIASMGKMFSTLLLIPRIKRAFLKGLIQTDFVKLQLDEADRYWCLNRNDYEYLGIPLEIRMKTYVEITKNPPHLVKVSLEY